MCSLTVLNDFSKLKTTVALLLAWARKSCHEAGKAGAGTRPLWTAAGTIWEEPGGFANEAAAWSCFWEMRRVILPRKYRLCTVFIMASIDALCRPSTSKSRLLTRRQNWLIWDYSVVSSEESWLTCGRPRTERIPSSESRRSRSYSFVLSLDSTSLKSRSSGCSQSNSWVSSGKNEAGRVTSDSSNYPCR